MKNKIGRSKAVQDLCRKLKLQLDDLGVSLESEESNTETEEKSRRLVLMEQLKQQLADLSQ